MPHPSVPHWPTHREARSRRQALQSPSRPRRKQPCCGGSMPGASGHDAAWLQLRQKPPRHRQTQHRPRRHRPPRWQRPPPSPRHPPPACDASGRPAWQSLLRTLRPTPRQHLPPPARPRRHPSQPSCGGGFWVQACRHQQHPPRQPCVAEHACAAPPSPRRTSCPCPSAASDRPMHPAPHGQHRAACLLRTVRYSCDGHITGGCLRTLPQRVVLHSRPSRLRVPPLSSCSCRPVPRRHQPRWHQH